MNLDVDNIREELNQLRQQQNEVSALTCLYPPHAYTSTQRSASVPDCQLGWTVLKSSRPQIAGSSLFSFCSHVSVGRSW